MVTVRFWISLMVVLAMTLVTGCGSVYSIDPTDPVNFNKVTVLNDLKTKVIITQCGPGCKVLHDSTPLLPAEATVLRVSNEGFTVTYLVAAPSGQRLGCLYFRYSKPQKNLHAMISETVRCSK
jgi:hypothetical protein